MLAGRYQTTPKICAYIGKTARFDLGNFAARLFLETEHCPHRWPTGVMLAVDRDFNLIHVVSD